MRIARATHLRKIIPAVLHPVECRTRHSLPVVGLIRREEHGAPIDTADEAWTTNLLALSYCLPCLVCVDTGFAIFNARWDTYSWLPCASGGCNYGFTPQHGGARPIYRVGVAVATLQGPKQSAPSLELSERTAATVWSVQRGRPWHVSNWILLSSQLFQPISFNLFSPRPAYNRTPQSHHPRHRTLPYYYIILVLRLDFFHLYT